MRTSTLSRSSSTRPGRRSRLVSVPVTGAAALALVLTGCGAEEGDGVTAVDLYNEEAELLEEDTEAQGDTGVLDDPGAVEEGEGEAAGGTGDAAAAVPGSFVAGGVAIPPLLIEADPQAALAELPADPAVATLVPVLAVPTDEGFWIGTEQARIWVQLVEPGESPVNVNPGDLVSFTGEVVPNADGFVEGLSLPADQAAALTDLGYHVEVPAGDVTVG
ncbi:MULTISPECIES: hypothetical protein [unclassified Modestobacter]|uniref:hypothetical protein n=1 Tax=unclassified Modestobacter TaxID=2643866 RepID=UPI0022AA41CF|nr:MULTISPECIES: hypothetical protein [unclassified Modestobacter]MCZ2822803.1 hypothetical protein [Modestobacter sp. VKM Ac-2981]MCZ2851049.1 hypothetical protein [Modestobacter sp. VKM Ac-2982]